MINLKDTWFIEYNNQKYFTVQDAIDKLGSNFKNAYLNFYDDHYGQYDWSIEPTESFEELKKQRALQIREKYNYIRIWASYAADSGTVINTFLKNNIIIDEIVNYVAKWQTELTELEREHHTIFVPKIKEFLKKTNKTKITLHDLGAKDVAAMMKVKNKNQSGITPPYLDVAHMSNGLFPNYEYMDVYAEGKPKLYIWKGRFFTQFDLPYVHDMLSRTFLTPTTEFFTSHELPKLHIKQCHLVKNKIKKEKPHLINQSFKQVIVITEVMKFEDGSLMETFIEDACRDFNDFGFCPPKTADDFPIKAGLRNKDIFRIRGWYDSDPTSLKDYFDYIKSYFKTPIFTYNNGVQKVTLNCKTYDLGS